MLKLYYRFRAWRMYRRAVAAAMYRKRGYDWAMSSLISGELTHEEIFNWCDSPFDGRDAFDHGALSAVYIHEAQAADPKWAALLEHNEKELQRVPYPR